MGNFGTAADERLKLFLCLSPSAHRIAALFNNNKRLPPQLPGGPNAELPMLLTFLGSKTRAALLGVIGVLLCAGQAHAASFVGKWDPAFGPDFPGLGWRGESTFEIPDACLAVDGVYTNFLSPCAVGGGLKIKSAFVEFYDVNTPGTVLDTLYFVEPSLAFTMEVAGGKLSGVTGLFLTFDSSNIALLGHETVFGLGFVESDGDYFAQMGWKQWGECRKFGMTFPCVKDYGFSELNYEGGSTFMTFREAGLEVPEPGSLALLIPALGILGVLRRRRNTP